MNFWNIKSCLYDYFRDLFPFKQILDAENQRFQQLLESVEFYHGVILDIGTGLGNTIGQISGFLDRQNTIVGKSEQNVHYIIGLDPSERMLRVAKRHHQADFILGNALQLPVRQASIAYISAIGVTEYVKDLNLFFQELNRVLEKDAILILSRAPVNIFFELRKLLLNQLYNHKVKAFESLLTVNGFAILDRLSSLMQIQYLIRKVGDLQKV